MTPQFRQGSVNRIRYWRSRHCQGHAPPLIVARSLGWIRGVANYSSAPSWAENDVVDDRWRFRKLAIAVSPFFQSIYRYFSISFRPLLSFVRVARDSDRAGSATLPTGTWPVGFLVRRVPSPNSQRLRRAAFAHTLKCQASRIPTPHGHLHFVGSFLGSKLVKQAR